MTARFAIYAVPGALTPDPLRPLGEAWLGRAADGSAVTPAVPDGWTRAELDAITSDARRYGLHLTVKAPFHLGADLGPAVLEQRLAALTRSAAPVTVAKLALRSLDGFLALMAGAPATGLHALAAAVVRELDDLRAPMSDAQRARRRPELLTTRQRELLDAWGYPYVLDEFRAHITLTDWISERRRARVARALTEHLGQQLGRDLVVDALCVCEESEPGAPFRLRSVHALGAGGSRADSAVPVAADRQSAP